MTSLRQKLADVFETSSSPLSVPEILQTVSAHKTSVYREMAALVAAGFLLEIDYGDGKKRFERSDGKHHHHLICIKCKEATDIDIEDDFSLQEQVIAAHKRFRILRHNLEFFGICQSCA